MWKEAALRSQRTRILISVYVLVSSHFRPPSEINPRCTARTCAFRRVAGVVITFKGDLHLNHPVLGKSNPIIGQEVEDPRFQDSRHMKVVGLSALRIGRLYPPGNIPGTHFCLRLSQPQGHSAAGRIMSMKNSSYTIGNRTRDLPACSAVPQPTAPPRPVLDSGWNLNPSITEGLL